jgi:acyl carrier protein
MDKFFEQMAEIFEVDAVTPGDVLTDFDAWDSLTQLSIIALASEFYHVTISASELKNAKTIDGVKILIERKK